MWLFERSLSVLVERLASDIVDKLDCWIAPDGLAHLDGCEGSLLCALNVIKLDGRRHLLWMSIYANHVAELSEVSVDIDNVKLVLGHVLDVD